MRWRSLVLMVMLTVVVACGDGPTAPPPPPGLAYGPVRVTLNVVPPSIVPGGASAVTVGADLPESQRLSSFTLSLSGFGSDTTLDLPIQGPGPHVFRVEIQVPNGPIAGELQFRAVARVGTASDSAAATLLIHDDGSPRLTLTAPQVIEPPDTLALVFRADDAAGITELAIRMEGAVQRDTTIRSDYLPSVGWAFTTFIPRTAALRDSVIVHATTRDGFGKQSSATQLIRIADTTVPTIRLAVDTIRHAGVDEYFGLVYFPGDIVRIRVAASDNRAVTWLGYRMLQFADSVPAMSEADSAEFEVVIPAGTNTPFAYIEAFARDSTENAARQLAYAGVMDGTFRPVTAVSPYDHPLIEYDFQGGYVLDATQDVLYFTTFSSQIHVLALTPLAPLPAIPLGTSVRGVDLSPSGDSLLAAVVGRPNLLLVWDRARGPATADTIRLTALGDCDVWDMQVTANGHAWVSGWSPAGCPVVDVDLRTRAQVVRSVPAELRNFVTSKDQATLVAWSELDALVYRSGTDDMTAVQHLFPRLTAEVPHAGPVLDHAGTAILIRHRLYEPDLSTYRAIQPDEGYWTPPRTLSADGRTAFFAGWPGYTRVDVATASAGERIILPRIPRQVIAHPDGQRLIVFGWQWVGIVDLR